MSFSSLVFVSAASAAGYARLRPMPFSPIKASSTFSGANLGIHATLADDQCPADLPTSYDVAAPPHALPKRGMDGDDGSDREADPLGLWMPPSAPKGPGGPNIFKLNQGRAIDILRHDYPAIFTQKPDLSIFTSTMELHDPSGKRLRGLNQYEKIFDMLRFLRRTTMQDAQVTHRLVVVDDRIRVRWSAKLWMRDPALGLTKINGEPAVVHLDGVSNYDLDDEGKIYKHVIENIIMRGKEGAEPVQLAIKWPTMGLTPDLVPAGNPMRFGLRPLDAARDWTPPEALRALFDSADADEPTTQQPQSPAGPHSHAAQPKQRRGGSPQAVASGDDESPMQRASRERQEDAERANTLAEMRAPKPEGKGFNPFKRAMPQACETSYDCERPDVCCDLLFGSVCCSGGILIPTTDGKAQLQRQAIPIPVERDPPPGGVPGAGGSAPRGGPADDFGF